MKKILRKTRSVCPVCLTNIPAELVSDVSGGIYLEKSCPEHGAFSTIVWKGFSDFDSWIQGNRPLSETEGLACPENCGICKEHESGSCCVLLEVTGKCNLQCSFCFAKGGEQDSEPSLQQLKLDIEEIVRQCGNPLLQLSGGEPTLRDDLPELISFAKKAGCSYVQINTNGIRLATDTAFVKALKSAGTDIIFLQFDGTEDSIYEALRGKPLLEIKKKAIENCGDAGIGVTLVPTIVKGVNQQNIGEMIHFAIEHIPAVRGIHFQPVSYFGRYPDRPENEMRYTLDELMSDITKQTTITQESFMPSRCDHPLCGFHSDFIITKDGELRPLSAKKHSSSTCCCASANREYVARHWTRQPEEPEPEALYEEEMDLDSFLYSVHHRSLTLSSMAFQDAMNLNIERMHRCSLHVYQGGKVKPFCANYLTPIK